MHKIVQESMESRGRVQAYSDSFILTESFGSVKYLSMFGASIAVKSLTAQIIGNRDSVHIVGDSGRFILSGGCGPLELTRGTEHLRTYTRNVRPGVTHKILYSPDYFVPWKKSDVREFITFGPTDEDARKRAFSIVDKLGNVPLKTSWRDWLWERMTLDDMAPMPIVGGDVPEFANSRFMFVPGDAWLEACIREDLEILKTA